MRALIQRVNQASVRVDGEEIAAIERGILIFLGVTHGDSTQNADWLADKIAHLRIFADDSGKLNLSVKDVCGQILVVSQFTLYADCRRGRRPDFGLAAPPGLANELYEYFQSKLREQNLSVASGSFGAHMDVRLHNDGPVTILLESPDAKEASFKDIPASKASSQEAISNV